MIGSSDTWNTIASVRLDGVGMPARHRDQVADGEGLVEAAVDRAPALCR